MKKILLAICLLLGLVGCATEESPEYYFDVALSEVENIDSYKTNVLIVQRETTLAEGTVEKNQDAIVEDFIFGPKLETMDLLGTFAYASQFGDFTLEDACKITCFIPVDEDNAITQTIRHFTSDEIVSIEHQMLLDGESISYCFIKVKTNNDTYGITITIEKAEA